MDIELIEISPGQWAYRVGGVYQEADPDLSGNVPMDRARAEACASVVAQQFGAPSVQSVPKVVSPRVIRAWEFRDRFAVEELAGLTTLAYGGDVVAQLLLLKISTATDGIDLDSESVAQGLDYLISVGRLAPERRAQVLA